MDAQTILETKPALTRYLQFFNDCFGRSPTRGHLAPYVRGQLGDLPRKSVEPIADEAGVPPRTLQAFLSLWRWDEAMMRDRLQQRVARRHSDEQSVGLIDEMSFVKKGDKTAGVQRQDLGSVGKTDNGLVSVHLGTPRVISIPCSTGSCTCPARRGMKTGIVAGPRASRGTWCTGPSGGSRWSRFSGRSATE